MGVKSTMRLTRAEAEARWIQEKLAAKIAKLTVKYQAKVALLSNVELEDTLEEMNDAKYADTFGGGGFDNYIISEHSED